MTKGNKPGRVAMKPERLRGRIIGVKVNPAEHKKLTKAAGPYPVAAWARTVLLTAATEDPFSFKSRPLEGRSIKELEAIMKDLHKEEMRKK
jgi:hypothetical protein